MAKKVENKKSVALNAADELGKKIRNGIRSGKFNFSNKDGLIVARKFQKEGYSGEAYVSKKLDSGASVRIEFLLKDESKAPRYFVEISYPGSVEGMVVKKSVTKSLDYLVCADPETMSGKAKKAREYGVRIIAEPAFFKMVSG